MRHEYYKKKDFEPKEKIQLEGYYHRVYYSEIASSNRCI